jgi:hypothetical protein
MVSPDDRSRTVGAPQSAFNATKWSGRMTPHQRTPADGGGGVPLDSEHDERARAAVSVPSPARASAMTARRHCARVASACLGGPGIPGLAGGGASRWRRRPAHPSDIHRGHRHIPAAGRPRPGFGAGRRTRWGLTGRPYRTRRHRARASRTIRHRPGGPRPPPGPRPGRRAPNRPGSAPRAQPAGRYLFHPSVPRLLGTGLPHRAARPRRASARSAVAQTKGPATASMCFRTRTPASDRPQLTGYPYAPIHLASPGSPATSSSGTPRRSGGLGGLGHLLPAQRLSLLLGRQVGQQSAAPGVDVVDDAPHCVEILALGIGDLPLPRRLQGPHDRGVQRGLLMSPYRPAWLSQRASEA